MKSIIFLAIIAVASAYGDDGKLCDKDDFRYEYTSCDGEGNRWRVAVPKSEMCANSTSPPPIRGKKCNFTCNPGHYLDINDQECKLCPNGTFSLGGGIRFDDWQEMPSSFSVKVEKFSFEKVLLVHIPERAEEENCTGNWIASGKYLLAKNVDCPISLIYEVDSVRDGSATFSYEHSDENLLFGFEVENQKCELRKNRKDPYRSLKRTEEGQFRKVSFPLLVGQNRLIWTVMPMTLSGLDDNRRGPKKFVKINVIEVEGVAYTSECTPCRAGTFSGRGESVCKPCPQDSFSQRGARECLACDREKEYSESGSDICLKKPPCTDSDYLEIIQPCDANGQTSMVYKWNDRMVCNSNLHESIQLPPNGPIQECPPCNPGMQLVDGVCSFCPSDEFSSGKKGESCKKCTSSTAPTTGIYINSWNNLNFSHVNLSSQCFSSSGISSDCKNKDGWIPNKDHIRTTHGHDPSAFLLLSLKVGGFKTSAKRAPSYGSEYEENEEEEEEEEGPTRRGYGNDNNVAQISFVFELFCSDDCILFFIKKTGHEPLNVIETWSGATQRTKFSYKITSPQPVVFSWTFQKVHESLHSSSSSSSLSLMQDLALSFMPDDNNAVARIYSINVTNTVEGGASGCELCPQGATRDGCVPCPEGSYVDPDSMECRVCTGNTAVSGGHAWSSKSCLECGEGLFSRRHELCITNCSYRSVLNNQTYNFLSLASPRVIEGFHLFTTSGYRYFNVFNISLCADHSKDSIHPLASCVSNFTSHDTPKEEQDDSLRMVFQASVCRSTALPSEKGASMLTNPLSFGDRLIAITDNPKEDIISLAKHAEFYNQSKNGSDVFFIYKSDVMTKACRSGRLSVIILRCEPDSPERVSLPQKCPDGTCDGCNLVILWITREACPICRPEDYVELTSQDCINGTQTVYSKTSRSCKSLVEEQTWKSVECSNFFLFQRKTPLWVKVVTVLVTMFIMVGVVSMCVAVYCWNKNKKLEYKYMKLIESSTHTKDGMELPGVDSCGIDEGDEEEQFDTVEFKSSKKKSTFFSKLAGQAGSRKGPGFFERVDRDEKMSLT